MQTVIPGDVQEFILQNIDTISELECLLLLRRESPKEWSAEELSKMLYISNAEAVGLLDRLAEQKLASRNSKKPELYSYAVSSSETSAVIDALADLYAKYLIPITKLVHSKPSTKIRQFADAFRLRKD